MNRKLRDTLIALSSSGLLLAVGLLAGNPQPLGSAHPAHAEVAGAVELQDTNQRAPRGVASSHRKFALPYFSVAPSARGHGS